MLAHLGVKYFKGALAKLLIIIAKLLSYVEFFKVTEYFLHFFGKHCIVLPMLDETLQENTIVE